MLSRPVIKAREILNLYGIENPVEVDLKDLVYLRNAILEESELSNSDGRTVFGKKYSIIRINKGIEYEGRKRFTIAHELGHLELHKNLQPIFLDDASTLQYFKKGSQETEANEFATELLMPEVLFRKECEGKKFSPDLLRKLAAKFKTSLTSTTYRFFQIGNHPICLFFSTNGILNYYKFPENYPHFIIDRSRLSVPEDSVAAEYFLKKKIYTKDQSKQSIWKSTWFELKHWEDESKMKFYEFCIITPKYNTVLSVVWEELR